MASAEGTRARPAMAVHILARPKAVPTSMRIPVRKETRREGVIKTCRINRERLLRGETIRGEPVTIPPPPIELAPEFEKPIRDMKRKLCRKSMKPEECEGYVDVGVAMFFSGEELVWKTIESLCAPDEKECQRIIRATWESLYLSSKREELEKIARFLLGERL